MIDVLHVFLHGHVMGTLTRFSDDRILFAFEESYILDGARATLSLSFKDQWGGLLTDMRPTRTRAAPFFANLLPEGHLREYLAARARVNPQRDFFLLWVLGQDLPGAILIQPPDGEGLPPQVEKPGQGEGAKAQPPLRFSLAGIQLKFSAVLGATGGLTIPAKGMGGDWIVKLPSSRYELVPENEHAMMTLAEEVGIDVPEIALVRVQDIEGLPEGLGALGKHAYAVKRFDRTARGPVHMEDFAQVFGVYPEAKYGRASYKNIAEVIWGETGESGAAEFIRRLVFSALIGNADMHLKNWSLVYPDGRSPVLSPAYDLVSTILHLPDDALALKVVRTKLFRAFSLDELIHLAARARLPQKLVVDSALQTVERFHAVWRVRKADLGLPKKVIRELEGHVRKVPLAMGK